MSASIIEFPKTRIRTQRGGCIDPSTPTHIPTKDEFIRSMKTRSHIFMFPTTLNGYKKSINPVDALYNTMQKIYLTKTKKDKAHVWITSLFLNKVWVDALLFSLKEDCKHIDMYFKGDADMQRIKNRFEHYIYVFTTIF